MIASPAAVAGRLLAAAVMSVLLLTTAVAAQQNDSTQTGSPAPCSVCPEGLTIGFQPTQLVQQGRDTTRPHAIEYSDQYATRLKIHQIASYVAFPLYAAEYVLGQKLLNQERTTQSIDGHQHLSLKGPHQAVAVALGGIFTVNTVTGVWNLYDSRHDPAGRTRRWVHSIAMMAADGGFLASAISAGAARRTDAGANTHRAIGEASMSLAAVASLMMLVWKD